MIVKYKGRKERFIIVPLPFFQKLTADGAILLSYLIFRAKKGRFCVERGLVRRELNFTKYRLRKALDELIERGYVEVELTVRAVAGVINMSTIFAGSEGNGKEEVRAGYEVIKGLVDGLVSRFRVS